MEIMELTAFPSTGSFDKCFSLCFISQQVAAHKQMFPFQFLVMNGL